MLRVVPRSFATVALFVLSASASAGSPYHLLKTIPVGGDGGFDYLTLDPDARRLYISRADRVIVFDVDNEKVVGEIPNTKGIHGIAIAPKHKRGFTSNGRDASVTIFDTETLKETGRVKVGERPDAIIYDAFTDRVFTFNQGGKDSTAIDASDGKVVGSVALKAQPEFAVSDGKGMIYVNLLGKNEVAAFDAAKLNVVKNFSLSEGQRATGIAMDRSKGRLFSGCGNQKMVVMSAADGKIIDTLPIGRGVDACAFDPETNLAFCSNGDGTINVIEEQPSGNYNVCATVKTQAGAKTMALDPKTHNIYLVTAKFKPAEPGKKGRGPAEPGSFVVLVVGR
jgi:DNA-binding beta-propeller fold protein YncE